MLSYLITVLTMLIPPHTNVVGEVRMENYDDELFIEAILDKRYLTLALMHEGDCDRKTMMEECGNKYVLANIEFKINDQLITPEKQAMDLQQDFVVFRYYAGKIPGGIHDIIVESEYMLAYHENSVLNVRIDIANHSKHFSLRSDKKNLTFSTQAK